jgi:hypothetical protein
MRKLSEQARADLRRRRDNIHVCFVFTTLFVPMGLLFLLLECAR